MNEHGERVARINFKQGVIVAIITAIPAILGTLLSTGTFSKKSDNCGILREQVSKLNDQLGQSIHASTFETLSDRYFTSTHTESIIDSVRQLIRYADELREHEKHYTFKLFLIKKIMINKPRGNINTRIDDDEPATYRIIQQILKEIEFYEGSIDGDRMKTYMALKKFQEKINNRNPNYIDPDNYGIFGNATLTAIRDLHEVRG